MYAITGITGQVGGVVARTLLASGHSVRAVVRDEKKACSWAELGCEITVAAMDDPVALASAFRGSRGAFILLPPNFDPRPGFPESKAVIKALKAAIAESRPDKVVCLSTIGVQAIQTNLLTQLTLMERALGESPVPVTFLRAAWFMENARWDIAPARELGKISSFLQPLDKPVPMVATSDVGRMAAELLQENWTGRRIVELEGPRRIAPREIAFSLSKILNREVRIEAVPRETWEDVFTGQGIKDPTPRIRMLDGFNDGWIEFERGQFGSRKGTVELDDVLRDLTNGSQLPHVPTA